LHLTPEERTVLLHVVNELEALMKTIETSPARPAGPVQDAEALGTCEGCGWMGPQMHLDKAKKIFGRALCPACLRKQPLPKGRCTKNG
jgi:hypothetical protein